MGNALISRPLIHEWSEHIGDHPGMHHTSIQRLLKSQRRLSRFVEENQESLKQGTGGVCVYMVGVIARMFELARTAIAAVGSRGSLAAGSAGATMKPSGRSVGPADGSGVLPACRLGGVVRALGGRLTALTTRPGGVRGDGPASGPVG